MTVEDRNYLFEEKAYLINVTMNRHYRLIHTCRMDEDDVYQELALCLIKALDKYDPERCRNLDAYLTLMLRYHLLHMKDCSKLTGVRMAPRRGFYLVSLNAKNACGLEHQIPVEDEHHRTLWLEQEINMLPGAQRGAIPPPVIRRACSLQQQGADRCTVSPEGACHGDAIRISACSRWN